MPRSLGVVAIVWCLAAAQLGSQGEAVQRVSKPPAQGPAPRTADGKVDFSGIWSADRRFIYDINDALKPGDELPIQPWALKVTLERLSKDDPRGALLADGRAAHLGPYPWRIAQVPAYGEEAAGSKATSTASGRSSWTAASTPTTSRRRGTATRSATGKATRSSSRRSASNDLFWFDFVGHPHTTRLRTVERYTRTKFGELEVVRVDRRRPRRVCEAVHGEKLRTHAAGPAGSSMEYICNENNQDVEHIVGKDPRNRYTKP